MRYIFIVLSTLLLFTLCHSFEFGSISNIAAKCAAIIQNPTDRSSIGHLERSLDVNCFNYYNIHVTTETMDQLRTVYTKSINTFKTYVDSAGTNEQVLYTAKNWLSVVSTDPHSIYQRQARECNAQLLMSQFGSEDTVSELPVFIQSLQYMQSCFDDVVIDVIDAAQKLIADYDIRIQECEEAHEHMVGSYENVSFSRLEVSNMKNIFSNNLIETFNTIYS
tara:strand:+ start:16561 stop:17223 length:663 start_codon:yes stop_codon:yes gene_type:complete